jgi:ribonucleases P/MRP protein subunit RPP40
MAFSSPYLDYCLSLRTLRASLLEGVQRKATKLVPSTRNYRYEERLKFFNLTTLETRRIRGDLIEVFKI